MGTGHLKGKYVIICVAKLAFISPKVGIKMIFP